LYAAKSAARSQRDEAILDVADAFQARNLFCRAMSEHIIRLDVREDLRQGREPFSKIMNAVAQLHSDEKLLLVAPFEPAPLFSVLGKQGFGHESKQIKSGDWEVLFTRWDGEAKALVSPERPPCSAVKTEPTEIIEVDARGLEPPQPMVKILEVLAVLPAGAELRARTDRRRERHRHRQLAGTWLPDARQHRGGRKKYFTRSRRRYRRGSRNRLGSAVASLDNDRSWPRHDWCPKFLTINQN
ncbi:MAG TPA: DUF2249 domain-containing protein, partial [Candidatus Paceibacterota bacterium]|nr:DUF2249 domain-containing protein [Candidatus Paceibacterota bacterium]